MTLMLLDAATLYYRAYYALPDSLVSPRGEPVNAIRGFFDGLRLRRALGCLAQHLHAVGDHLGVVARVIDGADHGHEAVDHALGAVHLHRHTGSLEPRRPCLAVCGWPALTRFSLPSCFATTIKPDCSDPLHTCGTGISVVPISLNSATICGSAYPAGLASFL